jgi:hypothetical protein
MRKDFLTADVSCRSEACFPTSQMSRVTFLLQAVKDTLVDHILDESDEVSLWYNELLETCHRCIKHFIVCKMLIIIWAEY